VSPVPATRHGWAMGFVATVVRRPMMVLTRRDWQGGNNLPASGGCVVAVNHVSEFDPLPFAHFVYDNGRIPRFLGKAEVFKVPIAGRILASAGQIPVYRLTSDAAQAFSAAVAAVEKGECVIVYPEGTLSRDPGLWPMAGRSGAARIALTTGCPVIPCAQWGPQEVLAPYGRRPRLFPRKLMRVRAGPPVELDDLRGQELTTELLIEATERIMVAITGLLEQIRGEQAPVERFNPRTAGVREIGNPNKPRKRRHRDEPVADTGSDPGGDQV
jgi:1-acyl-sn-glycerol-3-phosphate acyltransferase